MRITFGRIMTYLRNSRRQTKGLFALRPLDDRQRLRISCKMSLQDGLIELWPHHSQADQLTLFQLVNQPRRDWVSRRPWPKNKRVRKTFSDFWHSDLSFLLCEI